MHNIFTLLRPRLHNYERTSYSWARSNRERDLNPRTVYRRYRISSATVSARLTHPSWWSQPDSNERHSACKADVLTAELWNLVVPPGFEPGQTDPESVVLPLHQGTVVWSGTWELNPLPLTGGQVHGRYVSPAMNWLRSADLPSVQRVMGPLCYYYTTAQWSAGTDLNSQHPRYQRGYLTN